MDRTVITVQKIIVGKNDSGQRLDKFLKNICPGPPQGLYTEA